MLRWMCYVKAKDKVPSKELREKVGIDDTSGYATMVHGRGCNPHHCTSTFANEEITSL